MFESQIFLYLYFKIVLCRSQQKCQVANVFAFGKTVLVFAGFRSTHSYTTTWRLELETLRLQN